MNKKFFAALASATMALSATGSLAVFADDFDVVDETTDNNVVQGGNAVASDGSVVLNDTNFPDKTFRRAVHAATGVGEGKAISKDKLEAVKTIVIANQEVTIDGKGGALKNPEDVSSLEGIQYFTNLQSFTSTNKNLSDINLKANTKLSKIDISYATGLTSLEVPATNTLRELYLSGTNTGNGMASHDVAPLPVLDLSGNKGLQTVQIRSTAIAVLDFSNNPYLSWVDVSWNELNTLKLDGALAIKTLWANNNRLYSITLPENSSLAELHVYGNKLQALDVTAEPDLTVLDARNNCLKALDLTNNTKLANLNVASNNLGCLDLSKNTALKKTVVNMQHAFVDYDFDEVDLTKNFENLKKKNAKIGDKSAASLSDGVLSFKSGVKAASYNYNTESPANDTMTVVIIKADLMNRLYNPNSGEHFYTKDTNEKDVLVGLGWKDEGIGWVAPNKDVQREEAVYRLYNPNAGDHHYTTNTRERDALVSAGWKSEGIGWYSAKSSTTFSYNKSTTSTLTVDSLDLFREYNPNAKAAGAHNYTLDEAENDFLCSIGWIPEGKAWAGLK